MTEVSSIPRLLTFAPMIDSELSRLLLDHYKVSYREDDHLFGWVSLLTLAHGGYGRVPLLYGRELRLTGPRAIVDRLDPDRGAGRRLLPPQQPRRSQIEADWQRYNGELAADTAVVAYFHLLPERTIMLAPFSRGVPAWEAACLPAAYPALRALFGLLLRLSPGRAADALSRVRATLDATDRRIDDGRAYLTGDHLTLSDLALASAAAPLLLPDGYRAPIPALDVMPESLRVIISECRERPTSRFVQHIYDQVASERRSPSGLGGECSAALTTPPEV